MIPSIFSEYKKLVDDYLTEFLKSKKGGLSEVNVLGPDLIGRVKKLAISGKTIRGSLVLLSYCFTNKTPSEEALKAAAAMELLQTALLIHDDIMDGDDARRGLPAIHKQYKNESMAMCAGDVLFFMAFELLGQIKTDAVTLGRIIRFVGREYQSVGVAQMMDVDKRTKTKEEIFSLYTYKTARYTFAVPLMLGATIAGTTKEILRYLESYGVGLGILFQITDDALDSEKNPFTQGDIDAYVQAARESVVRLDVDKKDKDLLLALVDFVLKRKI